MFCSKELDDDMFSLYGSKTDDLSCSEMKFIIKHCKLICKETIYRCYKKGYKKENNI